MTDNGLVVREWRTQDLPEMVRIWNSVVDAANAFPQEAGLTEDEAAAFFGAQTFTAVAEQNGTVTGLYILHPNNVGRCGHIANASYAVDAALRGHGIGRALVTDCIVRAGEHGFTGLQFNAVVASNTGAIALYEHLGFQRIGIIPGGFRNGHDQYEDIIIFYISTR